MSSGVDEDYEAMTHASWEKPYEQVNHTISVVRKVKPGLNFHTRDNHDYHMTKFKKCVYCDNGIPLVSDDEVEELRKHE